MDKANISIIGSANADISEELKSTSRSVGRAVIDCGYRLVNGGMGGVMCYSAQGARSSSYYKPGDTVGILPSYNCDDANAYIDISIPTGLGVARNTIVVSASNIVITLDGGAGTLSELALAWQMKKDIICFGKRGWHKRLDSMRLDKRPDNAIKVLEDIEQLKLFLNHCKANKNKFSGINRSDLNMSFEQAIHFVCDKIGERSNKDNFFLLGHGQEGCVISDGHQVYKVFGESNSKTLRYSMLKQVSRLLFQASQEYSPAPVFTVHNGKVLFISYEYMHTKKYSPVGRKDWIFFLGKLKEYGLCVSNIKPDNLCLIADSQLMYIDIGQDILIYDDEVFMDSCLQAFSIMTCEKHKIHWKVFHEISQLSKYLVTDEKRISSDFQNFYRDIRNA